MAQRTIAAFFQSRPPPREALGDATNATAPVATSDESIFTSSKNDDAARTTTPPPKRARVAAPLPFAKGADVMDVRGASSRAFGAQFCAVDGREILLCGHAWAAEDFTRPKHVRWKEPDERAPSARRDDDVSSAPTPARSSDDDVSRVGDVVIRGTDGLVARADGAVIRVYDAGAPTGAAPLASLCLAHDDVSSDANACECTRRATFLDAGAVTRMTSYSDLGYKSDASACDAGMRQCANLAATTAGGELAALSARRERGGDGDFSAERGKVVIALLGRALLTEGTFQHAFPDTSPGFESRFGPFCMWRAESPESREMERTKRVAIARFAVAATATGALCFVTLLRGDAESGNPESAAVARLDRVVSPHLPCLSRETGESPAARARSVIHDVATWTRRPPSGTASPRSRSRSLEDDELEKTLGAAVSVGGDGVLAVTHFDADDDALDTAWRCVPDAAPRARHGSCATRVAVCDLAATAVTLAEGGPRGATATVWTLENETELRRVPLFPEASGKPNAGSGSDKGESCPGRVSGLAIDTRGRLIAASFDDARSGRGAARVARGR